MNIPQAWQDVLRSIQDAGFPEAIIAGGALRDLDHGVEIKDVDIFVKDRGEETYTMLCRAFGYEGERVHSASLAEYRSANSEIVEVYEFYPGDAPPYQVIVTGDHGGDFMQHQLDRFDIGLCRVAYNGRRVEYTSPYCHDKALKLLRLISPMNEAQSIERLHRIGNKYPEHKLIGLNGAEIERTKYDAFDFDL